MRTSWRLPIRERCSRCSVASLRTRSSEGNWTGSRIRKGSVSGRVVLGERLSSIRPTVQATEVRLTTQYDRLPFPLAIAGGEIAYDGRPDRDLGSSRATGGVLLFGPDRQPAPGEAPRANLSSGQARLSMDELHPLALVDEVRARGVEGGAIGPGDGRSVVDFGRRTARDRGGMAVRGIRPGDRSCPGTGPVAGPGDDTAGRVPSPPADRPRSPASRRPAGRERPGLGGIPLFRGRGIAGRRIHGRGGRRGGDELGVVPAPGPAGVRDPRPSLRNGGGVLLGKGGSGLLQGRLPPPRRGRVVGLPAEDPGRVDDRLPCPPGPAIGRQPDASPRSEGRAPALQGQHLPFDGGEIRRDPRSPLPAPQGGPEPFGGLREPGSFRGHRNAGRGGDPDPLEAARPPADPERVPFGGGEEDPGGLLRPRVAGDPVPVERGGEFLRRRPGGRRGRGDRRRPAGTIVAAASGTRNDDHGFRRPAGCGRRVSPPETARTRLPPAPFGFHHGTGVGP